MKIFHSELTTDAVLRYKQLHPSRPLRALISYGRRDLHHSNLMLGYRRLIDGLIMDSGTYTLNQNRKKYRGSITFEGYRSYLGQFSDKVDFYFNFDEDFSVNGFERNFGYQIDLEKAGFNPVPVVHDCYGPEIQTYLNRGHKLIAIGSGELKHAGVAELYRIVDGLYQKGIKVHFLGCTQYEKLAYVPVYSADSTTWNRTGSSGRIFYWNPKRIGYNKLDKIVLDDKPPKRLTQGHSGKGGIHPVMSNPIRKTFYAHCHNNEGLLSKQAFCALNKTKNYVKRYLVLCCYTGIKCFA